MVLKLNKLKPCKNNSWVRKRLGLSLVKENVMMEEEGKKENASGEEVGKSEDKPEEKPEDKPEEDFE